MTREEAIKELRCFIGQLTEGCQEAIKVLIPELKESEDERIRKVLVSIVKWLGFDSSFFTNNSVTKSSVLAYLEKQKHKPTSVIEILARAGLQPYKDGNQWCILAGGNIQEGVCGFGDTIDEALYQFLMDVLEKQQQPAKKWSEEDARILYNVIAYIGYAAGQRGVRDDEFKEANAWLKSLPNGFVVNPNYNEDMINLLVAELQQDAEHNGAPRQYDAEIAWLKSLRPQPKPEWNEKDKLYLQTVINEMQANKKEAHQYEHKTYDAIISWLKSFSPQLKPEWSEEDESMLNLIITDVRLGQRKCGVGTDEWNVRSKAVRWLKSLPKRFNLQPQPKQYKQCIYGETPSALRCAVCSARCDIRVREEQKPEVKIKGWIARNGVSNERTYMYLYNNAIIFSETKPTRNEWSKHWGVAKFYLAPKEFPDLKWEDEPIEVELTIKKK